MTLDDFRERVNVFLHPRREGVLKVFRTLNVFVTLIAFGSLVAYYGYPLQSETANTLITDFSRAKNREEMKSSQQPKIKHPIRL